LGSDRRNAFSHLCHKPFYRNTLEKRNAFGARIALQGTIKMISQAGVHGMHSICPGTLDFGFRTFFYIMITNNGAQ
jgi:hypothetical protein